MATTVNNEMIETWRAEALQYLREHLRERAPAQLGPHHIFDKSPLEGEGPVVLFEFTPAIEPRGPEQFFVAVGQTELNYYAAQDLSPDDMFALHLGTRFMLVLGVAIRPEPDSATFDLSKAVCDLVWSIRPEEPVTDVEWAAAFDVEGSLHGVARFRSGDQAAYAFIGDAPPGFSTRIDISPQVAYRIHLGRTLMEELARESFKPDKPPTETGGE